MNYGRAYYLCGALCIGIALQLIFFAGFYMAAVLASIAVPLLLVSVFSKKRSLLFYGLLIFCVSAGAFRAYVTQRVMQSETTAQYFGEKVTIEGVVVDDPSKRETSLSITLKVTAINGTGVKGTIQAQVSRFAHVSYGDYITLQGTIEAPEAFETATGHTFDYPHYLEAHGIAGLMRRADITSDTPASFTLLGPLFAVRHVFDDSLERLYVEPDAALMEGILLGEKRGITQVLNQIFIQSGLIHVVVLSGYNIAVVSNAVAFVLAPLPRVLGLSVAGVFMTLLALMTGAGAATVRALLMALVVLVAKYLRRPSIAIRSLVFAATAMALWSPLSLLYDSGFILSVLATFGLITLSPWVEKWIPKFLLKSKTIGEIGTTTIAVQIFTLPALLYFSGVLSIVSVPANMLALPVIPYAMLGGFIAGLFGLVSPILGFIPAFLSDLLLKWFLLVANTAASIPFGSLTISEFPPWVLFICYIPFTWAAVVLYQKYKTQEDKKR